MTEAAHRRPSQWFQTHDVTNQVPPLQDYDAYGTDPALREAVAREAGWGTELLEAYGGLAGGELMAAGFEANHHKPEFHGFDRYGHRIDEVHFHPSYHRLMSAAIEHGVHALSWTENQAGSHVVRAALSYLHNQAEQGTSCPLTMTHACIPALRHQPELAEAWLPGILSGKYDPANKPYFEKAGLTIGMGMTEKQGGSDVRANSTRAVALAAGGPGGEYELVGHKWFFSAPMCDAFLVLAYAEGGLSCFLLPRWRPDGSRNAMRVQRLKDKLGNWSNASSEVEFHGAFAWMVGEEGRGVATILEMVALTRLDCMIGSAALMRQALVQAMHHANYRSAFGKRLIEQPLMQQVLADLALESEAAMAMTLRVARAVDAAERDPEEAALARITTAIGKYWICKRAPVFANEAQECLGGAGYVEESMMPRLYREAPLNSIWEGSGNIQCLDVLRALAREPDSASALFAEIRLAADAHPVLKRECDRLQAELDEHEGLERRSRWIVERLALLLQASLLLRHAPRAVADAFVDSRLDSQHGMNFGTLPDQVPLWTLIERAWPEARR